MLKWKKVAYLLIGVVLIAGCAGTLSNVSKSADPATSSIVIGRLTGTIHPLPGFFYLSYTSTNESEVEILGYRLVGDTGDVEGIIRPGSKGYFFKELAPGTYTIRRIRSDRLRHRDKKHIDILTFNVEQGQFVNLGTIRLVLEGIPDETYYPQGSFNIGEYIYRYHYERATEDTGWSAVLSRFRQKRPEVYERFRGNSVRSNAAVTKEPDTSKIVLRDNTRNH